MKCVETGRRDDEPNVSCPMRRFSVCWKERGLSILGKVRTIVVQSLGSSSVGKRIVGRQQEQDLFLDYRYCLC